MKNNSTTTKLIGLLLDMSWKTMEAFICFQTDRLENSSTMYFNSYLTEFQRCFMKKISDLIM